MYKNILLLIVILVVASCTPAAVTEPADPTSTATGLPAAFTPTTLPTLTPVPTATLPAMDDFMKGVSYVQWDRGGFTSQASDTLLGISIPQTGATWIALIVTCNQKTIDSTDISCENGPTDEETIHAIQTAHAAGLRVMLKPHLDVSEDPGHWRGEIGQSFNQSEWEIWFENYTSYITHFASLAQDQNVDAFVVGTELVTPSAHDPEWREIIRVVRSLYTGPLTYAGFQNEFDMTWWDALDMIGVDAYYSPISNSASPTPEQLVAGWEPFVTKLEALSKRWGKPILFTEVGYQSLDKVGISGGGAPWTSQLDVQEQADCYAAVFQAFSGKPWWRGAFWWVMDTNAAQGGVYDKGWSFIGKPAEDVLRQYYGSPVHLQNTPSPSNDTLVEKPVELVYDDDLISGWEDWSWGVDVDAQFNENPYDGDHSLYLNFHDNQWDTLSLQHASLDLHGYEFLQFYILSENDTYVALRVELISDQDVSYFRQPLVFDPKYIEEGQRQAGKWQRVRIPISTLAPENPQITRLNIYLDGQVGTQVQIDQIRFLPFKETASLSSSTDAQHPSTEIPTSTDSNEEIKGLYDGFNDLAYDGSINTTLWTVTGSSSSATAIQQDGVLVLSDKPHSTGESLDLGFKIWEKPTFGFLEARIRVQYEEGSNGNITLDAISPAFPQGWSEMGFTPRLGNTNLHVDAMETRVPNDTWYVLRIEFHDEMDTLLYFIDGKQIESYVLPEKATEMYPGIQLWHPTGSFVTAYIDYVAIGE